MPGIYGGDDISAIVLDAGSCSVRAGWAGEDTPRVVTPSYYGWLTGDEGLDTEGATDQSNGHHDEDGMEGLESNGVAAVATTTTEDGGESTADNGAEKSDANGVSTTSKKAVSDWELQKRRAENRRRYVGDGGVNIWRKGLEVGNPFEDGVCECTSQTNDISMPAKLFSMTFFPILIQYLRLLPYWPWPASLWKTLWVPDHRNIPFY
jgi:actin-related protein 4